MLDGICSEFMDDERKTLREVTGQYHVLPAQRAQYEQVGYVDDRRTTGRRYRVRRDTQMNVDELDQDGGRGRMLGFTPCGRLRSAI